MKAFIKPTYFMMNSIKRYLTIILSSHLLHTTKIMGEIHKKRTKEHYCTGNLRRVPTVTEHPSSLPNFEAREKITNLLTVIFSPIE